MLPVLRTSAHARARRRFWRRPDGQAGRVLSALDAYTLRTLNAPQRLSSRGRRRD